MNTSVAFTTHARPWGASRLAPYPTTIRRPHATVTVDPATQLGVFRDRAGQVVEMGKHGTSSATETSTSTSSDGQSGNDQGHDQDSNQD
ncbi:putative ATP-grasp-modified RiPP [Streptomyces sp. NBC_00264]|uniref:putative ATP-grasp-modified RiPP n=1 Tax=unclassified Streptomyces TaxID=2593676 RepID=UPI000F5BC22C|nr:MULTISPECIES: putative ATP-grasp-modified RiPP [unclassified Streptomyces]WSG52972.1 putative ATP-grasp-modified RiPP [Streptomyces sp. NBC_01732]WSX03615.1 putative ATP-grasp-modified RiPP [Streptomyces sp. NBC_00987]MCX4394371.1 putative ATP-grasp-modified RiPP [Streptomyces sp. NBC_01767]MCX5102976.1 putative ATP-grasp-modified RiPP [Streptomyces sp. NBC_00439]MCX5162543.1 putative ATP-grasp-modified RiPP [Streptomyces sp. NBC_00305]